MICYIIIAAVYLLHYGLVQSSKNPLTIGGGVNTDIRTHKYMVSIHVDGYRCGGSILTKTLVITAAHCTYEIEEELIRVHVGSSHRVEGGEYKNISEKIEHINDGDLYGSDIGLLVLEDTLTYDDHIGAINLATPSDMPFKYGLSDGTLIKALGFGEMQDGSFAHILQEGDLRLIDDSLCENAHNVSMSSQLCVANLNITLKDGDDGSPVLYENKLVGIVSLIDDDYDRRFSILEYVPCYLDTILDEMRQHP